jgi:hypothetical protein
MNRTVTRFFPSFCSTLLRSAPVGLVMLTMLFAASSAKAAGCGIASNMGAAPSIPFVSPHGDEHQDGRDSNGPASIVGLWHTILTANSAAPSGNFPPTPFQFVESFRTWHADGTEFDNAFLPPTGGNICFGVWKETGHGSVKLHHIGLVFDSMGRLSNIFTTDETATVARNGKTYTGTFDWKLWPPNFDAVGVGTPLAEVKGTALATRITVD